MKNLIFISLMMLTLFFAINAQDVDLKAIKAEKEAEAIKKYTDSITDFYLFLYQAIGDRARPLSSGKVAGVGLKDKAGKIRVDSVKHFDNVQSLIVKLKVANRYDEQFDKDTAKLVGSNKVKSRLTKSGGARKLFESILNSTATTNLKNNVSQSAELIEFTKDEDVCKFIAVGIVIEVLSSKKSTTTNNKIYEMNGCHK